MAEGFWHERLWLRPKPLCYLSGVQMAVVDVAALRIGEDLIGFEDVLKGLGTLACWYHHWRTSQQHASPTADPLLASRLPFLFIDSKDIL